MIRHATLTLCAAIAAQCAATTYAATIFWQGSGVSGTLTQNNYSDGTNNNLSPNTSSTMANGDIVNFGGGGAATHSSGSASFQKLRVGHGQSDGAGAGTVTVRDGASISTVSGGSGAANAGIWVGQDRNGTLNIDGAGSSVTSNRLIIVGYAGNRLNRSGTINITDGGSLTSSLGNIHLGDAPNAGNNGMQGHMFVDGNVTASGNGANLNIGLRNATSSFTQTGGTVQINNNIEVGAASGGNSNSFFTISGGTTTHGNTFFVGRGTTTGATVNISGTGVLNTGNRFLMGAGTATGVVVDQSGGTLNVTTDIRVADAFTDAASTATYYLSDGTINSLGTSSSFVGRQGVGRFYQTGGKANFSGSLAIGNSESSSVAADGLYKISGGELNVALALNLAAKGAGQLRVVGDDGIVDVNGNMTVFSTADGLGTLAFELESGDLLSMIDVAGTATFNLNSSLVFDTSNAAPTKFVYNLLTATEINDNGLDLTAPAGWYHRIISGGNGKILQVYVPEPSVFAFAAVAIGAILLRRQR